MRWSILILALLVGTEARAEAPARPDGRRLLRAETLNGMPLDALRIDDALRFQSSYAQGGDLIEQFLRIIFPISGREKRPMFMPLGYWGAKKPRYTKFDWRRFKSPHFDFYTYPEGELLLPEVVRSLEEDHDRNNRIMGVENRFLHKIPVIYYHTRRDFEQTSIIEGPIPEGLGGLTEIFSWQRVIFPFEGEMELLEHVSKHEAVHIYQIAKGARRLPLWFTEGLAETLSMKWDAQAEMVIRDAFLNGFFFSLADLWQIDGTWLMYKEGNFIANLLWDQYGEKGIRKIMDGSRRKSFEDNLKLSLDLTVEQLDSKISSELSKRYSHLLNHQDLADRAETLRKEERLVYARGPYFISGGDSGPRNALFLNHVSPGGKVTRKELASDRKFGSESLDYFRKGAWMDDKRIIYAIRRSSRDVLRIVPFTFDAKEREFTLGDAKEISFNELPSLSSPVLLNDHEIAFIGYSKGFTNLYRYDLSNQKLEALTDRRSYCANLDYSPVRNELVFSQEDAPVGRAAYDRNLYSLHLGTRVIARLTHTPHADEIEPRFSPDGKQILYVSDPDGTFDLFRYDYSTQQSQRLTQMRVGALHPQWSETNLLLFNAFEKTEPIVYRVAVPTGKDLLEVAYPSGTSQEVRLGNGTFTIEVTPIPTPTPTELTKPGLTVREADLLLKQGEGSFSVEEAARLSDRLVLAGHRGLPGSNRLEADDRMHYFVLKGSELASLSSTMVAQQEAPPSLLEKIKGRLKDRALINTWIDRSVGDALILVNNRVGTEPETFKKKDDVGVLLYRLATDTLEEIESGPLGDVRERLQWVSFLQGEKILLAIGDDPLGPFSLDFYDRGKKDYEELDDHVDSFRISIDRSTVVWQRQDSLYRFVSRTAVSHGVPKVSFGGADAGAYEFDEKGRLIFFRSDGERWSLSLGDGEKMDEPRVIDHPGTTKALAVAIDRTGGTVAVRAKSGDLPTDPEEVVTIDPSDARATEISAGAIRYDQLAFRQGYLTFVSRRPGQVKTERWVWRGGETALFDLLSQTKALKDGSLLLAGNEELVFYDAPKAKSLRIAGETAGFDLIGEDVLFSASDSKRFQLYRFDRSTGQSRALTAGDRSAVEPVVAGHEVLWSSLGEDGWRVDRAPADTLGQSETLQLEGYDLLHPRAEGSRAMAEVFPKPDLKPEVPRSEEPGAFPSTVQGSPAPVRFRLQSLAAAAAYDGSDVRFFLSAFADDLFSDRGIFANASFLSGDSSFATAGYADLNRRHTYSLFYNSRDSVKNTGFDFQKDFILDRYRQVSVYGDFEFQIYGTPLPGSEEEIFVTPDVQERNFYLLKAGVIYGYDVTLWDRHGPISGSRFFARAEAGYDVGNTSPSNLDVNIDFRLYNRLIGRLGLAHRIVAGTSQGDLPNVYLLGGNLSFRGVDFDDLKGQNYWVFSEDLRVPIFDVIGAKLFDPLDQVIGFLTRYFDVRGGIYCDVGSVWMNDNVAIAPEFTQADVRYSVGYFVNVPTIFGLNFRWSQGFAGEDGYGFWFGFNW